MMKKITMMMVLMGLRDLGTCKPEAMQRCKVDASAKSPLDSLLDFWVDWQIVILMLITMSMQFFLVSAGFFRKHTSIPALHACVWVAFLTLDACAMYSLGLMLSSGCDYVFSLYAPILLFHLSAADAINAYAATDNDLWHRYAFKMGLEIVAAAYIVSRSTDCPKFTTSGVLLFVVGAFRYGERVFALRSGSQVLILATARPVFKYMALNNQREEGSLIVSGEQEWYEMYNKGFKDDQKGPNEKVTFQDVQRCQSLLKLMGHGVVEQVCLAYALFKIFRRRLTNLRIHQKEEDYETQSFDGQILPRHWCHKQACLANLLVLIALVTECLQIWKIVRSNWLRVWLASQYITEGRLTTSLNGTSDLGHYRAQYSFMTRAKNAGLARNSANNESKERWGRLHLFNQRAIACAFRFVGKPKSSHWNFKLGQLSILVDSLNLVRWHYLVELQFEKLCEVQSFQLEITNLFTEIRMEKLQDHLVEKVVKRYKEIDSFKDICHLRNEISENIDHIPFDADSGLEDVVLKCHLLTCVFELNLLQVGDCGKILKDMDVIVSIGLSRYCMHLMLRRPKLMPEDPDVARVAYDDVKQKLKSLYLRDSDKSKSDALLSDSASELEGGLNVLQFTRGVLSNMTGPDEKEKWRRLAKVWLDILMYVVNAAENAFPHTEQMAKGGELLTHFWVLLGHLGPGQRTSMVFRCA